MEESCQRIGRRQVLNQIFRDLIILKAICQKKKSKRDPLCFAHDVGLGGIGYLGFFDFA